jgi:hypothetical protein
LFNYSATITHKPFLKNLTLLACGLFFAGLSLTGCGGHGGGPSPSPGSAPVLCATAADCTRQTGWKVNTNIDLQPKKKWTFLVYMNGANDLEPYGIENMNQMEKVGSTAEVNIVVQYERIKGRYDTTNGDWGNTRRFYVTHDGDTSTISSTLLSQSDADMGLVDSLKSFVDWGVSSFPAEQYALVLWDHGAGWRAQPIRSNTVTRGLSYNDKTNNHIDTIDLPQGLTNASLNNGKWDLLVIDCSLMQMAEVAYEIRNNARYIVGSEESPPGSGYPYDKFLAPLTSNPSMNPLTLGKRIISETYNYYGTSADTTQSVLDTSRLSAIAPALDNLGTALYNVRNTYSSQMATARTLAEEYGHGTTGYTDYKDMLDYLRYLSTPSLTASYVGDASVQSAVSQLKNATQAAILANYNATGHPNSNGLSLFVPSTNGFRTIDISQANGFGQRYNTLAIAKDAPNWLNFIQYGSN